MWSKYNYKYYCIAADHVNKTIAAAGNRNHLAEGIKFLYLTRVALKAAAKSRRWWEWRKGKWTAECNFALFFFSATLSTTTIYVDRAARHASKWPQAIFYNKFQLLRIASGRWWECCGSWSEAAAAASSVATRREDVAWWLAGSLFKV